MTYSNDPLAPTHLSGLPSMSIVGTDSNTGSVVGGVSPTSQYVTFTVPSGVQNCVSDPADQSDLLSKTLAPALSGPLQAGDCTLWIQRTAAAPVSDAFKASFAAVPAPAPLLGLGDHRCAAAPSA